MQFRILTLAALAACAFTALPAMAQQADQGDEKAKAVKAEIIGSFYGHTSVHQAADDLSALVMPDGSTVSPATIREDEEASLAQEREAAEKAFLAGGEVYE